MSVGDEYLALKAEYERVCDKVVNLETQLIQANMVIKSLNERLRAEKLKTQKILNTN